MLTKRNLGTTDLQVPPVALGGNVFGWTVKEAESLRLLDRAFELGLTFLDTADVYSAWAPGNRGGESETIIGKWLARGGKRTDVVVATKVGWGAGLRAAHIQRAVEDSLRRLQTDYIDLYFSHIDDRETPLEETLGAYRRLIEAGKVRFIGASNYTGARLREALEISRRNGLPAYQALQPHYNLLERAEYESDLAPVVAEYRLGVTPYYALASGFLTGKYRTESDLGGRARGGGVKKYLNPRGLAVIDAMEKIARERGSNPASVALAWLIQQPHISAPIASATSERHLDSLAEAAALRLEAPALEKLAKVSGLVGSAA